MSPAGDAGPRRQEPRFGARVEGVRIDALVTVGGRPVAGLGAEDFEVRDNGVLQTVDLVSLGDVPVSVVLTLDLSASVSGPRLEALGRAGVAVLEALTARDAAALVTFNRTVSAPVPLTTSLDEVRRALLTATAGGDTALVDAVMAAMLLGDADVSRTLVVLFSDGLDTASFTLPDEALATARTVNGIVYAVSAHPATPRVLRDITAVTGGRVVELAAGADPRTAFLEILDEFRRRYVLSFAPSGPPVSGWHTLQVSVKTPGARVQARTGYMSAGRR